MSGFPETSQSFQGYVQNAIVLIGTGRGFMARDYEGAPAKFNAGYDLALHINFLFKSAGNFARMGDFVNWYNVLQEIYRWVSPKLNDKEKGQVEDAKPTPSNLSVYQKKILKKRKAPSSLSYSLFNELQEYEVKIRFYVDKKGMGMPEGDDPRFSI